MAIKCNKTNDLDKTHNQCVCERDDDLSVGNNCKLGTVRDRVVGGSTLSSGDNRGTYNSRLLLRKQNK